MACRIENVKTLWLSPNRYSSTNLHFLHKPTVDRQLELVNVYFSNATFSSPTSPSQMITKYIHDSKYWRPLMKISL